MREKIKKFLTNYKISLPILIAILVAAYFIFVNVGSAPQQDFIMASSTTIAQEVSVTGRVEPSKVVDLSLEASGKVSSVPVVVGQRVAAGQTLLRVDTSDLSIRLAQERAALEKAKIELAKAEPKTTATDDLEKAYEDGFNVIADAYLDLPSIVSGLDDILDSEQLSDAQVRNIGNKARDYRDDAEQAYYTARRAFNDSFNQYKTLSRASSDEELEAAILTTYEATKIVADSVKVVNNFVDYVEDQRDEQQRAGFPDMQNDLDGYTAETNDHLAALLDIKDTIEDSKIGITDEGLDLEALRLDIREAELDIEDTQQAISDRILRAPISGVVTAVDAEVGETVSTGADVVSIMSSGAFQIAANVPEADIAKVHMGAEADIELDAYSDVIFKAKVVSIDPAETVLDGVATYATTLEFVRQDERIKSGMTADITIKGERKENVIAVPQRSIVTRDGMKFVRVLEGEEVIEKPVETGLRGSDGNIEIVSGLIEGARVVVYLQSD